MRSPSVLERLSGGGTALSTRFKVLWVAVFISVGVFFWSVYHSDSPPPWSSWTSVSSSAHGLAIRPGSFSFGDALPARPPTERVWLNRVETARSEQLGRNDALHSTMIVIFSGTKFQTVAKYFFESMKRQKNVDLVMVQHGDHCIDLEPYSGGSPNIRSVCFSEEEFWQKHIDYLCGTWGGCTKPQSLKMLAKLMLMKNVPAPQQYFPVLRGWVFQDYVNPRSPFWGWCDMDTMMGDLDTTLPWDLLPDYDIMTTTNGLEPGGKQMIFLRGHLSLVKNSQSTEEKFLRWEYFRSFDHFDRLTRPDPCIEEAEYSSFMVGEPDINFLIPEGMAPVQAAQQDLVITSSAAGVLQLPIMPRSPDGHSISKSVAHALSRPLSHFPRPTFTDDGFEKEVVVHQALYEDWPEGLPMWFNVIYGNWYDSHDLAPEERPKWRRFLYRKDTVWRERFEPVRDWSKGTPLEGSLRWVYVHWQAEKRQPHFREMKPEPVDIFIGQLHVGNSGFDSEGNRIFWEPFRGD